MVVIISVNVRGISAPKKRRIIFKECRERGQIILLQETHSTPEQENIWQNEWGGKIIYSHGTHNSRGVCVLFKKNCDFTLRRKTVDPGGRYIIIEINVDDTILCITNVYAPNSDTPEFFNTIFNELKDFGENRIIMGDFNLTLSAQLDRLNTYCNNNRSKEVLINIMETLNLQDIWRVRNGDNKQYTWFKMSRHNEQKGSRIDFALTDKGLDVENVTFFPVAFTDHRAVFLAIKTDTGRERGKGYWKFNNMLLHDVNFVHFMNNVITEFVETPIDDPILKWTSLKETIRKSTRKYSREKRSDDKVAISQLLEITQELLSNFPLNKNDLEIYEKSVSDLEQLQMEQIQGVIFRSKAKWHNEGEKNTRYFLSLEKTRYNSKICKRLLKDGAEVTDPDLILEEQVNFYTELYTSDKSVSFGLINEENITIPETYCNEANFSEAEVSQAVYKLNNNKTPGIDGIGIDFYKVFWKHLRKPYMNMLEKVLEIGEIDISIKTGILNLIPKDGKDTRLLKNLRPITVLNTDYKIIEKCISNRLKPCLKEIINPDQTGFMADRKISTNIRKLFDLMYWSQEQDEDNIILSCDFLKCFDRIEFDCIRKSLKYFGFSDILCTWIDILYDKFRVQIQSNGYFSKFIEVTRSVHQGGCCSAEIFLVCAETLAILLRRNKDIKGIKVEELINLINQFADDLTSSMEFDERSLNAVLRTFEEFRKNSGFTLSYEKTTLYRIGSLRKSQAKLYTEFPIQWSNDPIHSLGIWISTDIEESIRLNYSPLILKVQTVLSQWQHRNLSLMGKVTVVNTLVASLFVYKMTVLPNMPECMLKQFDNIIRNFLWNGKKSKIALATLQNMKHQGGLKLVNLRNKQDALKISWLKVIEKDEKMANLAYQFLNPTLRSDIWLCNLNITDAGMIYTGANRFWTEVLQAWAKIHFNTAELIDQTIWYNSNIRINGNVIFWEKYYTKGLLWLSELIVENKPIDRNVAEELYGMNFLDLLSIYHAYINAKTVVIEDRDSGQLSVYEYFILQKSIAKKCYNILCYQPDPFSVKLFKWIDELNEDFIEEEFISAFKCIYSVTNATKYRSFQFRLLHRAIITNIHLKNWGKIESDNCEFCHKERETYVHLFYRCEKIKPLWPKVITMTQNVDNIDEILSAKNIICNSLVLPKTNSVNCVCLLFKQYIYKQRCFKKDLNFQEFNQMVNTVRNIEKYNAIRQGKLNVHNLKWCGDTPECE